MYYGQNIYIYGGKYIRYNCKRGIYRTVSYTTQKLPCTFYTRTSRVVIPQSILSLGRMHLPHNLLHTFREFLTPREIPKCYYNFYDKTAQHPPYLCYHLQVTSLVATIIQQTRLRYIMRSWYVTTVGWHNKTVNYVNGQELTYESKQQQYISTSISNPCNSATVRQRVSVSGLPVCLPGCLQFLTTLKYV